MHERSPHFPQSGTRDTGMSQAYMTESRETTKKTMQSNTFQKTFNKSRQNPKRNVDFTQEMYTNQVILHNYGLLWEKAMAPHSSTLAWKIPWTEEPGRLQSMGSLGVGHD